MHPAACSCAINVCRFFVLLFSLICLAICILSFCLFCPVYPVKFLMLVSCYCCPPPVPTGIKNRALFFNPVILLFLQVLCPVWSLSTSYLLCSMLVCFIVLLFLFSDCFVSRKFCLDAIQKPVMLLYIFTVFHFSGLTTFSLSTRQAPTVQGIQTNPVVTTGKKMTAFTPQSMQRPTQLFDSQAYYVSDITP